MLQEQQEVRATARALSELSKDCSTTIYWNYNM